MGLDKLFIVRHGETQANELGVDAGPLDYPLTKKGKKDVAYLAKALSKTKFKAAYSSPVFRAVQTAKILARPHKLKIKTLEDLTETKLKPEFVGKEGRHHILTTPEAFDETYEELQARVLRAVDVINKKEQSGNVIVVSHGGVILALLHHVVERKIESSDRYYVLHPNPGALSIVEFKERPQLMLFNYYRKQFNDF